MNRSTWFGWTLLIVVGVLVVLVFAGNVKAQFVRFVQNAQNVQMPYVTVPEDRAKVEAKGWEWLGLRDVPFTVDTQLVYYHAGPFTLVSLVVGGCVSGAAFTVGVYEAETRA